MEVANRVIPVNRAVLEDSEGGAYYPVVEIPDELKPKTGDIIIRGYEISDPDWRLCNGDYLLNTQHPELYSKLGMRYGEERPFISDAEIVMTNRGCYDMCYSPQQDKYVTVGWYNSGGSSYRGISWASADGGKTWTEGTSTNENTQFETVAWSPALNKYVAYGYNSSASYSRFYSSADGLNWTLTWEISAGNMGQHIYKLIWSPAHNRFIGAGSIYQAAAVWYSDAAGNTWTRVSVQSSFTGNSQKDIAYSPASGLYVMAGGSTTTNRFRIWTSYDGMNWSEGADYGSASLASHAITWDNGMFILVGNNNATFYVYTSFDAVTWTNRPSVTMPVTATFNSVFYSSVFGKYFAGGGIVMESADGLNWSVSQSVFGSGILNKPNHGNTIVEGNNKVMAHGTNGANAVIWNNEKGRTSFALPDFNANMPLTYIKVK